MGSQFQLSRLRLVAATATLTVLSFTEPAHPWPMPRIPKEQIPDDMPPDIRKHVEGLYDIRDDNVCLASAKALGEMGPAAAPAAPFLASVLDRHKTCKTPNAAADALVRIGKASVEPTILALKVGDAYGRTRAIDVLRQLKDPRAVAPLVNAIADGLGGRNDIATVVELGGTDYLLNLARDPTPEIRQVAMRVLPRLASPNAAEALVNALNDPHEKVRQLAIHGLNDMVGKLPSAGLVATNSILAALKAPDSETRRHTLRLIMRLNFDPKTLSAAVAPILSDPDATVLAEAVSSLGSLKTGESVALLRQVEGHPDPLVRAAVATAMGDTGCTSAVQAVEALLADQAGIVREHAVGAIAALKGREESPRLIAMLKTDRDALVKRRILQVLANWNNYAVVADLDAYMADDDESVRTAVLDLAGGAGTNGVSLLVQGLRSDSEKVREYAFNIMERNTRQTRETADLLLPLMNSSTEDTKVYAARLLARDPSLVTNLDAVARAVDDRNMQVRCSAIRILGQRRDNRRIDSVRAAAKTYDEGLALTAVEALVQFGDVASLAEATRHPFERVRHTALDGLARIGTPESQKALADIQKKNTRTDMQPIIASTVAERTGKSATPEMLVASFVATRGQSSPGLRSRLVGMGTNVTGLLVGLLTNAAPSLRAATIDVIAEIKDTTAVAPVLKAVDDPVPDVRERAVCALGALRERTAVQAICGVLDDESPSVREQAVLALGSIGDPSCLPALLALTNTPDWRVRGLVMQSAGKLKDPRSASALRGALLDAHWHVRGMAAEALGSTGDRRAVPDLVASLDDPHWNVRKNAAASLRTLTGESLGPDPGKWQQWWWENQGRSASSNAVERAR